MNSNDYILVIGGSNVDITGIPDAELVPADSNPGSIFISGGGVGRNIAENIARLKLPVRLLTAVGNDYFGEFLKSECLRAGINIDSIITSSLLPTSAYLCIMNGNNEMSSAVNDMKIMSELSHKIIATHRDLISGAAMVVADNNISSETLEAVKAAGPQRLLFDAVSGKKLKRTAGLINNIDTVKLNSIEAEILSDIRVNSASEAEIAAEIIAKRGIKHIFITMGSAGALYYNAGSCCFSKPYNLPLRNATGAGDAFLAGIAYGHYNGITGADLLYCGTACAAAAAASEKTVSDKINPELIMQIITGGINEI